MTVGLNVRHFSARFFAQRSVAVCCMRNLCNSFMLWSLCVRVLFVFHLYLQEASSNPSSFSSSSSSLSNSNIDVEAGGGGGGAGTSRGGGSGEGEGELREALATALLTLRWIAAAAAATAEWLRTLCCATCTAVFYRRGRLKKAVGAVDEMALRSILF